MVDISPLVYDLCEGPYSWCWSEREGESERVVPKDHWRKDLQSQHITAGFIANFAPRAQGTGSGESHFPHLFTDDLHRQWRFSLCTGGDAEARQAA